MENVSASLCGACLCFLGAYKWLRGQNHFSRWIPCVYAAPPSGPSLSERLFRWRVKQTALSAITPRSPARWQRRSQGAERRLAPQCQGKRLHHFAYLLIIGYDGVYQGDPVSSSVNCPNLTLMPPTHDDGKKPTRLSIFFSFLAYILLCHGHKEMSIYIPVEGPWL